MIEAIDVNIGDIIYIEGEDFYKVVGFDNDTELVLEYMENIKPCEACGEVNDFTDTDICEDCDHDQRKPVMGGYDPELDEG